MTYLDFLRSDDSFFDEFLGVLVEARFRIPDFTVHERLCEHRLVNLIVTVTTVRHLERMTEFNSFSSKESDSAHRLAISTSDPLYGSD